MIIKDDTALVMSKALEQLGDGSLLATWAELAFSPDETLLCSYDNSIDLPGQESNPAGTQAIWVCRVLDGRT